MIRGNYKRRHRQLPDYDEVRRRFAAGVSLVRHQTPASGWTSGSLVSAGWAPGTYRCYEGHIRLHLKPYLGQIPLEKLRRAHIRAAYDQTLAANATRDRTGYVPRSSASTPTLCARPSTTRWPRAGSPTTRPGTSSSKVPDGQGRWSGPSNGRRVDADGQAAEGSSVDATQAGPS